ncbi:MAG TPA: HNH endonuclease signature motif containing protein [Ktedonobacterales bacterium]|nr:HNH endonuclease signature motif containing protein [Ktedonobacterales bacterium]
MSGRAGKTLRAQVRLRAGSCCEYCGMPDGIPLIAHEPDHVIARQHGGATTLENLAYTCHQCNRFKGPNLASIDPLSHERTFLFSPRTERWQSHFRWNGPLIEPLTATGRATAELLRLNDPRRVAARDALMRARSYPFAERPADPDA